MKYYLGVDGGGTKTEFVWANEYGEIVFREIRGSSNPNDIGKDKMISDLVVAVSENIPQDADGVDICMGLSGINFSGCKQELETALRTISTVKIVDICSDIQIAMDSAYDQDGCIVIIGTGSVGYLRKKEKYTTVGGCGFMIDVSLSGYDLGRAVIDAVASELDCRGEKTVLTTLIKKETGTELKEIIRNVYIKGKSYIASFAPFVFQGYEKRDAVCISILQKCVENFEGLLNGVYRANGKTHCEITLFGGLSKKWEILSSFLSMEIKEKIDFKMPKFPIIYGTFKRLVKEEDFFKQFKRNLIGDL